MPAKSAKNSTITYSINLDPTQPSPDVYEFLRQIFKVLEKIDSAGLNLKYVFGKIYMEEDNERAPVAK